MNVLNSALVSIGVLFWQLVLPFQPTESLPAVDVGQYVPVIQSEAEPTLAVGAKAALVEDANTRAQLYAKNADQSLPIASLTKLMTTYIITRDKSPDDIVVIPDEVKTVQGGENATISLQAGDRVKMRDLLQAALIPSANDAAVALAVWHSGSVENFVTEMNRTAQQLKLDSSKFTNPTGLDPNGSQASAKDLALLTHFALASPLIEQYVSRASGGFRSETGRPYAFVSTNQLLSQKGVKGVKTGYTLSAGQCLITLTEIDGRRVITVVLASPDRFSESRSMINWGTGLDYE